MGPQGKGQESVQQRIIRPQMRDFDHHMHVRIGRVGLEQREGLSAGSERRCRATTTSGKEGPRGAKRWSLDLPSAHAFAQIHGSGEMGIHINTKYNHSVSTIHNSVTVCSQYWLENNTARSFPFIPSLQLESI